MTGVSLLLPGATAISLTIAEGTSFDEWRTIMHAIARMRKAGQWWIGDGLNFGERKYGEVYAQAIDELGLDYQTLADEAWVARAFDFSRRRENLSWSHHREVAALPPAEADAWLDTAEAEGWSRKQLRSACHAPKQGEPIPPPDGKYSCLVVDPPWPMEKIEREVRPAQVGFDYPTMTEEELRALPISDWSADDAHLYLWVTHKFLPMGLMLAEAWGFHYQCLLTWVKHVGMTPFSWMYSTEHVLFCRRGNLPLVALGQRLDFAAPATGHSIKPDAFFDLVRQVSPGPRIEVFARLPHEGFVPWGNEVAA